MVSRSLRGILLAFWMVALQVNALTPEWMTAAQARGRLVTQCTVPGTVGMTFDDGPHVYTKEIVDLLKSYNATATFFLAGSNYDCIYSEAAVSRVKYAYDSGMHLASHAWSHGNLAEMDPPAIHDEMYRIEPRNPTEALLKIVGVSPAFMRPPYGSYNQYVLDAAYLRGQAVVLWDFDSGDSTGATPDDSIRSYEDSIRKRPSTILALNHDTYESTAHQVIPDVLPNLKAAGYQIVDVAACLGQVKYQEVGEPSPRDSTWHC
ncbi:carbohydrate esterase family 4 protein [Coprinellus micaceus]|uniref:Carbohydrate esterase family 4 protein n=1 Tax=Coprinellus micaceus TaxID=71717 RepID=A0A4Y7TI46_COPMI|nr:carbohydrate esterase family 4 protein [Coprinellus micaceus]